MYYEAPSDPKVDSKPGVNAGAKRSDLPATATRARQDLLSRSNFEKKRINCCLPYRYDKRTWRAIEKARDRIDTELDFLSFYRKMEVLEKAFAVLFSKKERYLLRKQNTFVLDSSSTEC